MTDDALLGRLADEFIHEVKQGKLPDIEEYAAKHPELADRIRELFPTLLLLEGMAATGSPVPEDSPDPSGLSPGKMFGHYRIGHEIGRGGMGIVYEAVHVLLEKRVALKVLPIRPTMDSGHLERFFREARTAAGLHHTNIVPVFDVGQVAGIPYYAMEYIEGRSLNDILHIMQSSVIQKTPVGSSTDSTLDIDNEMQISSGSESSSVKQENETSRFFADPSIRTRAGLPDKLEEYFRWVAGVGIQTAEGLAHAHERKVIHRDIKPSNLLIDEKGVLWITDFGLARRIEDPAMTQSGTLIGTPRYMSPEQAEAARRSVDQRTDIYSLGATLYELLTCRHVFDGRTPHDVITQIINREPVAPIRLNTEIPKDLSTIVMKAMAKRPEDRYQSASQLAEDLQRWLRMEPIKARRIGPVGRTVRWCRRNPGLAAVTAAAAIIILTLSSIYYADLMKEINKTNQALLREKNALHRTEEALKQEEVSRKKADTAKEQAEVARVIAENAQKVAESERNTAQEQKQEAQRQQMEALYQSYRSNILAADISINAREIDVAREQLASCDPSFRGWEWNYLHHSIDTSLAVHSLDDPDSTSALNSYVRNMEVAFNDSDQTVFIKAYYIRPDEFDLNSYSKVSVFRYLPGSAGSFARVGSDTNAVTISPNGLYTLSSAWNLDNVSIKCVAEGSEDSSNVICQPVQYRSTPGPDSEPMDPEFRDRLIVTDTMSGRVIATLHHPNTAVWNGDAEAMMPFEGEIRSSRNDPTMIPYNDAIYLNEGIIGGMASKLFSFYRSFDINLMERFGHYPNVVGGAFSKDGSRLATWSWDNTIYVWDIKTQSLLTSLKGHLDAIRSVSFSPDMVRVASSSVDGTVRLWLIESGEEIEKFQVLEATVLAYSPDGSHIAVGTYSGSIMIFDARGENVPLEVSGHSGLISSLAFSPDSARLVTASIEDNEIRLWDVTSGNLLTSFVGHIDGVSSVAFSKDGMRIVSGSEDKTIRIWNARSPLTVLRDTGEYLGGIGLTLTPNGAHVLTYVGRTLKIWDTTGVDPVQVLEFNPENSSGTPWISDIAIYQDKIHLAMTYQKGDLTGRINKGQSYRVIDMESGDEIFTLDNPDDGTVNQMIRMTPDAKRAVVLSFKLERELKEYALVSAEGFLRLWDTQKKRVLASWNLGRGAYGPIGVQVPITLNSEGRLIAKGVNNADRIFRNYLKAEITIFDANLEKVLSSIPIMRDTAGPIALLPDGKRIAIVNGDIVEIWDLHTPKKIGILEGHNKPSNYVVTIRAIAVTPDGSRIVTGGADSTVRIWDANRYKLLLTLRLPSDEKSAISALAVSSDGSSIAASRGGEIYIWNSGPRTEQ